MTDLLYVENMRVAQAKLHESDTRWYVVNAAGYVVRGPYPHATAEVSPTSRELAEGALEHIRAVAREEALA